MPQKGEGGGHTMPCTQLDAIGDSEDASKEQLELYSKEKLGRAFLSKAQQTFVLFQTEVNFGKLCQSISNIDACSFVTVPSSYKTYMG